MVSVPLSLLSLKHLQALTSLLRVRNNAEDLKRRHVEKGIPDVLSHVILHPSRSSGETKELKST